MARDIFIDAKAASLKLEVIVRDEESFPVAFVLLAREFDLHFGAVAWLTFHLKPGRNGGDQLLYQD